MFYMEGKMKKKKIILIIVLFAIASIFVVLFYSNINNNKTNRYVLFNNGLYLNKNKVFYENELKLNANQLGKCIGKTSENQQVYSIYGLDSKQWICMRNNGKEYVYRSAELKIVDSIEDLKIDGLTIFEERGKEVKYKTSDKKVLKEIEKTLDDSNVISGELIAKKQNLMSIYSSLYKGLSYNLYYIRDERNDSYLYDDETDVVWKLKKKIFNEEE